MGGRKGGRIAKNERAASGERRKRVRKKKMVCKGKSERIRAEGKV